eukprot:3552443-Rhodomonas_salina.1
MLPHPIDQHPQPSSVTPPLSTQLQRLGMFSLLNQRTTMLALQSQLHSSKGGNSLRCSANSIVPLIGSKDVPARLSLGSPRFSSDCESAHLGRCCPSEERTWKDQTSLSNVNSKNQSSNDFHVTAQHKNVTVRKFCLSVGGRSSQII